MHYERALSIQGRKIEQARSFAFSKDKDRPLESSNFFFFLNLKTTLITVFLGGEFGFSPDPLLAAS